MTNIITAIAAAAFALCALAARADATVINYGPALKCTPPVNGIASCKVVATGRVVQCSLVDGIKICF